MDTSNPAAIESPPCECPLAGWCDRHHREKIGRLHELCQTRADYRAKWDKEAEGRRKGTFPPKQAAPPPSKGGAGTELKKLLSWLFINESAGCKCAQRAAKMDSKGPDWCEASIDEILQWMEEEAAQRGIVFIRFAAAGLVRLAIAKARRNATESIQIQAT